MTLNLIMAILLTVMGLFIPSPSPQINKTLTKTCGAHCCAHHSTDLANTALAFGSSMAQHIRQQLPDDTYTLKTVVIDAGHGGTDSGARGRYTWEKKITLDMAKQLGGVLEVLYPNLQIVYTRTADVAVPLFQRASIANENKADLFLSIHCNFFQNGAASGTETYVMGLHTTDYNLQVAKRENSAILVEDNYQQNYGGYDPNSPEGHIILSMYQDAFLENSIAFADKVEKQFQQKAQRKSRGVKQAGFVVLKGTTMPSVLIELGFLSNRQEEQYLASDTGQQQLANAIAQAFVEYKNEIEGEKTTLKIQRNVPRVAEKSTSPTKSQATIAAQSHTDRPLTVTAQDIHYKVLLIQTSRPLTKEDYDWNSLPYLIEEKRKADTYQYMAAGFTSYEEATTAKEALRKGMFPEAFVIAMAHGKRISMKAALEISENP